MAPSDMCTYTPNPAQQPSSVVLWYKFSHPVDIVSALVLQHLMWFSQRTKSVWSGIRAVTTLITESLRTLTCSSVVFPCEIAEKAKGIGGEFYTAGKSLPNAVWLCIPPYVLCADWGEGEDVQRPGSDAERGLKLGMLLGLSCV